MNGHIIEKELSLENYNERERELIIAEVEQRIGERAFSHLPEAKNYEFQEIVYDNIEHIDWWLKENDPEWRESEAFKDAVEIANEDGNPDNIRPEKIYATMRWIELNLPNYDETAKQVIEEYRGRDWTEYLAERK